MASFSNFHLERLKTFFKGFQINKKMDEEKFLILKKLGKFSKEIKKEILKFSKVGFSDLDIINYIEKKIFEKGYLPAFPCMVCINEVAAHYTIFETPKFFKKSDLVTVDFGISHKGIICDTAISFEIETNKHKKLMEVNKKILDEICSKIKVGTKIFEIGELVSNLAKENNFNSIHNLSGHQISENNLHCGISIPNYNNLDEREIENNMLLAIEPFITYGENKVCDCFNSNILVLKKDTQTRDIIARRILNHIKENYKYLPFSKRWLVKDFINNLDKNRVGFRKQDVLYGVEILKRQEILYEYSALKTIDDKVVSQFEHTIFFFDGKKYIIS